MKDEECDEAYIECSLYPTIINLRVERPTQVAMKIKKKKKRMWTTTCWRIKPVERTARTQRMVKEKHVIACLILLSK